ncbi:SRPBCC family protein [Mycobacterium sp. CBMA293]|uniref:SRPBCC family protein n=1 Tax=unclassified Mycolicibacterium TaxID=2636767 RepID=UPI0012DD3194|nr:MULTISPECIES: SRPBCC family protein [unclassified Mycolicibacterium]MUL47317.1 SRPBCC family protein [Mycolicibacterium sp. CBMA 360]MUL61429.1 SRPBCC family protein [Mycolicibacterium sp. CBMA 335]MUL72164.1 SRPBCC family protein [Mycolicibacterium sp. CBMA 311]MUL96331.1 SRPBCC family protein [Mycolicibacterium sp. CBMA 230]MUM08846.1 MxaD family protein [Mycolicibacterium sp. CBMA 213]
MQSTATATVARPIDVVWATLTDHEGMANWGPGMSVTIDEPGSPDRNGLGAVRRISAPGPAPAIVEEVVTFDAPNVFGYKARSGVPFPGYSGEVRLTSEGTGTRIDYTLNSSASFPPVKLALAAVNQVLLRLLVKAAAKA